MNREKEDQLPMMQVGFIDSICLPIYEVNIDRIDYILSKYHAIFLSLVFTFFLTGIRSTIR